MDNKKIIRRESNISSIIKELELKVSELDKKVITAGYIQRNAVISHVYSNYNKPEDVIIKNNHWKGVLLEYNVHSELYKLLIKYRDLYGLFPNYESMVKELNDLIRLSIEKEYYEITAILKKWADKLNEAINTTTNS